LKARMEKEPTVPQATISDKQQARPADCDRWEDEIAGDFRFSHQPALYPFR
jgi:hypothetical protein